MATFFWSYRPQDKCIYTVAKFDAESDFEIRLAVARQKPDQINEKLISRSKLFVDFFVRRRKMKCRGSSETCFPKV